MDFVVADSAVWNDDAVCKSLDSAAFWVKGLPFVKSLSGYWNFFLAANPNTVPMKFYDAEFQDSEWQILPGPCIHLDVHTCMVMYIHMHTNTYRDLGPI